MYTLKIRNIQVPTYNMSMSASIGVAGIGTF